MAIIKAVSSKASIGKAINYVTKDEKTEDKLISGKDCSPSCAIDEMKTTKAMWDKTDGRQYMHFIQSFDPNDKTDPKLAHEIGIKFAEYEKFKGHEVLIATHIDKEHVHNHFIVNTVNFENGKKFHHSKFDLRDLKAYNDKLCIEHNLSIATKGENITAFNMDKYKVLEKGFKGTEKSYLLDTAQAVSQSLSQSKSKDEFIKTMMDKGYEVQWKDDRKYVTYTTPDGHKVRNSNLEKTFKENKFSKEGMENEIFRNRHNEQETRNDTFTRTEHESKNGIREHSLEGITGAIEQSIQSVNRIVGEGNEKTDHGNGDKGKSASDLERLRKSELEQRQRESEQKSREKSNERDFER